MPDENLGSGLKLDQYWDFSTGTTGDLETVSGRDELQKDLAVVIALNLQEFLGRPPTSATRAQVKQQVRGDALNDIRVAGVDERNIDVTFEGRETIVVELPVVTNTDEQYDLVFEV